MLITFGCIAIFFVVIVVILQLSGIRDRNFTEYAVGGRSFGADYQAMSFLNTWYPGGDVHGLRRHGGKRRRHFVLRAVLQPAYRRADVSHRAARVDLGQDVRPAHATGSSGAALQFPAHQNHCGRHRHRFGHSVAGSRHAGARHAIPAHVAWDTLVLGSRYRRRGRHRAPPSLDGADGHARRRNLGLRAGHRRLYRRRYRARRIDRMDGLVARHHLRIARRRQVRDPELGLQGRPALRLQPHSYRHDRRLVLAIYLRAAVYG